MAAEDAFRAGRYDDAVTSIDHALVEQSDDGYAMLLLSQSLFAVGNYEAATAMAYRGMSQLDPKDWGFVVENYAKYYANNDYVTQMRKLNQYIKDHDDAAYARALRGYHFGFLGYEKQAREDLGKAVELEDRDQFAGQLLTRFGGSPAETKPMLGPPPPPPPPAATDKQ
jgi:tetratricopeptide (TPR) repeat protein